ncbi:MAG: putative ABC transporter permease [Clostridiales bacterium]|nr:putative ABC transporter permease [Clostridiales bacterium]
METIFYFLIYAVLGWCAEVAFAALRTEKFVNRGYLTGPYCPIYGFGVIFVIYILNDLQNNKLILFIGSILIASLLEFLVGFFFDKVFHQTLWDYKDNPFNIGGYVCLSMSILWGIGCVFVVDYLHVFITKIYVFLPHFISYAFIIIGIISMGIDTIINTSNILKLNKELKRVHEISDRLMRISDDMGKNIANTTINIANEVKEINYKLGSLREEEKLLIQERAERLRKDRKKYKRLLHAYPKWMHEKFQSELEELKNEHRKENSNEVR